MIQSKRRIYECENVKFDTEVIGRSNMFQQHDSVFKRNNQSFECECVRFIIFFFLYKFIYSIKNDSFFIFHDSILIINFFLNIIKKLYFI